ncbi:MAG: LPS-assembly protein LptD [Gemmatimonadaceae bacterium]
MRRTLLMWMTTLAAAAAPTLAAQQRPDTVRTPREQLDPRDSTARTDTTQRVLVEWAAPDSIMRELLAREGFIATRYQGETVVFDAARKEIIVLGDAAVGRDQTTLVADTIRYSDSLKIVRALGDTIILRDPSQTADLVATGRLIYDVASKQGSGTGIATSVQSGEVWYVEGPHTGFRTDTTSGERTFYATSGTITSCDLTEPHYHFKAKEVKMIGRRALIARPAVLYIHDIPVLWVPFIFQDLRRGRRSGLLPPRFGFSDIVRNSTTYRRHIDGLGWYWAINDYMDAQIQMGWRSGARGTDSDPGWLDWRAEWQYNWLARAMRGGLAWHHTSQTNDRVSSSYRLWHSQQFSMKSSLRADLNYQTNTSVLRDRAFTAEQTFATIYSSLSYDRDFGPFRLALGGTQQQSAGLDEIRRTLPTLSITPRGAVSISDWFEWNPTFSLTNSQILDLRVSDPRVGFRFTPRPGGGLDSARVTGDQRQTTVNLDTPLRFFGFSWSNNIRINDREQNHPIVWEIVDPNDPTQRQTRVYANGFSTEIEWQTSFSLPRIFQGRWNIVPSIQVLNQSSGPFAIRNELTGGRYVRQGKRLAYALSMSPTFYGLFPGFGPVTRFRHTISPSLSYTYAPAGRVTDEYLAARNQARTGNLSDITQQRLTLSFNHNLEAKLRGPGGDTSEAAIRKVKVFSMGLDALSYNFERARKTGRASSGFETSDFGYNLTSDLLPGFQMGMRFSLFEGDIASDTATFKPFRTSTNMSLSIGRDRNPFAFLAQIFGKAVPSSEVPNDPSSRDSLPGDRPALEPGSFGAARDPRGFNPDRGWSAQLSYSYSRQRPPRGVDVQIFDPRERCRPIADPIFKAACEEQALRELPDDSLPSQQGIPTVILPPQSSLRGSFSFNLTPKWAAQWSTSYDFETGDFADHSVTLQRDLHDWRATFGFNRSPFGNFAFSFFIALKAEPQLKFDYNRSTYRPQ